MIVLYDPGRHIVPVRSRLGMEEQLRTGHNQHSFTLVWPLCPFDHDNNDGSDDWDDDKEDDDDDDGSDDVTR